MAAVTFCVGDKIAVTCRSWLAPEMHRVARVLKHSVELDDGSRWDHDGQPYPRDSRSFILELSGMQIAPWTKTHERDCMVAEAIRTARNLVERLCERELKEAQQLNDELQRMLHKLRRRRR